MCRPMRRDFGVQIFLFEPVWASPWPVRRRRRKKGTHLDAVQRRHAHVEEDPVEHRHGNVLGTGRNRGPDRREGSSSFPGTGTSTGGHEDGAEFGFFTAVSPDLGGEGGRGMFYLQDGSQENRNPRQHEDDDAGHPLLPGTAREAGSRNHEWEGD